MDKQFNGVPINGILLSNRKGKKSLEHAKWRQTSKTTYCIIPFIEHARKEKCHRKQISGCQGPQVGVGEWDCKGKEGTSRGDGNVLYYDYGDDYTSVPICQNPFNCTIK